MDLIIDAWLYERIKMLKTVNDMKVQNDML